MLYDGDVVGHDRRGLGQSNRDMRMLCTLNWTRDIQVGEFEIKYFFIGFA